MGFSGTEKKIKKEEEEPGLYSTYVFQGKNPLPIVLMKGTIFKFRKKLGFTLKLETFLSLKIGYYESIQFTRDQCDIL